jgi:hypothetical protein
VVQNIKSDWSISARSLSFAEISSSAGAGTAEKLVIPVILEIASAKPPVMQFDETRSLGEFVFFGILY